MGENKGRVPIVIDPDMPCPLGNLKEAADGFTSMGEILRVMPAERQLYAPARARFTSRSREN